MTLEGWALEWQRTVVHLRISTCRIYVILRAALTLDRYGHLLPGQAEQVALRLDEMARQARPQRRSGASIWLRPWDPRGMDAASLPGTSNDL